MPVPSLESNSAPWAKEHEVIRKLLSEQQTDLASAQKSILSKQRRIADAKLSIKKLEDSLTAARATLEIYEKHHTRNVKAHQELVASFSRTPSSWYHPTPSIMFMEADVPDRIKVYEAQVAAFAHGVETLRLDIDKSQEEIKSQRHHLVVDEMSLRTAHIVLDCVLQTMRELERHLRPIKRVPDEIWLEILTMAVNESNKSIASNPEDLTTISPALLLSHVCLTWQRVLLDSPRTWTSIHSSVPPESYSKKRQALLAVLFERTKGFPLTIVHKRNSHSTTQSSWSGELHFNSLHQSREATCHNLFSHTYPNVKDSPRLATEPKALILEALSSDEPTSMSITLTQELKEIRSITLINVALNLPHPLASNKLTHLKIEVKQPPSDKTRPLLSGKYNLAPLLSESIQSLHLAHYSKGAITLEGGRIELPNLHTLSITTNEHGLADRLVVPSLQNLTIYSAPTLLWPANLGTLCRNISSLTMDWVHPKETKKLGTISIVPAFIKLFPHAPKLNSVTFANGRMDGAALFKHLEQCVEKSKKEMDRVTIEGCLGVSRADCERLATVVGELGVFRTFHLEA